MYTLQNPVLTLAIYEDRMKQKPMQKGAGLLNVRIEILEVPAKWRQKPEMALTLLIFTAHTWTTQSFSKIFSYKSVIC